MDPIKEAMIREEDTGERNPALDPYRDWKDVQEKYPAEFVGPVGRHALSGECQARPRNELEREIMSASVAKNDREWWAMEEIEALRKVEAAARKVVDECRGDFTPSLGSMAKLADALHSSWRRRQ